VNPAQLKRQIEGGSVMLHRPEVGKYGQGSEAANALAGPAIAGAFLDATGKVARRLPLKAKYVKSLLNA
jgi:CO/xanthine dehydrogenase Mo-binding subunit